MKEITIKRKDRNIDVIKEKMLEILDEYEEAKEVLKNKPEKKRKFVFRKFKKQFIIFGLVAALGASTLGLVSHFKKKNHQKNIVPIETTTEYKDDINDDSIKEENDIIIPETDVNNFSNDNVSVDESYKNLKYTGNGKTVSNYAQTSGVGAGGSVGSTGTTVTEKSNDNLVLPPKPADTVSTVIVPEQPENNQTTGTVTEVPGNNDNNTNKDNTEKVTIDENEEVPNPSENNPSKIEEDPSNNNGNDSNNNGNDNNNNNNNSDNNESNTTEDVVIPPKPEENNPSKIEETGDDDIIYFDEHGNTYTIPNSPKSQETTEEKTTSSKVQETIENTKEEEKTTIEENEEVPSFETPTEIEEEKEQYIALREAITSALAQNNVETENMEESQVLTYRM